MKFNTALLHGDFRGDKATGATLTPVYQSSAFEHESAEELEKIFNNRAPGFSYTRISNPTIDAFEKRMTALEGGVASVACASGMAALYNAFCNILCAGDEIVSSASLYGGSIDLFRDLESFGIKTRYVENNNIEEFRAATNEHTRLYFAETIGNPRLDVTDIKKLAELAHSFDIPLIMDNTVATAYLVKPLSLGADIVVNSTSKYINANSSAISGVITELQNAFASARHLFDLIDEPRQSPDSADARVLVDADGRVKIENVSFSYTPDVPLIENFNLDVKPGQRIAIVGPTGCGKTTFINLLMRFYDVTGGKISISGTDADKITRNSLRGSFGMVLQDTWLKSATIRENIAYGKPDATEEEVVAAAKAAYAHGFIKRLPHGYDTVISEDGENISQGQKQLLCIARAMLCLPPMLILDEATSSIDTRTEIRVQSAFEKMMQGRTSFIVAHRLSTIRNADVILVMNNGQIIEQGNHSELMAKDGFYAQMYNSRV